MFGSRLNRKKGHACGYKGGIIVRDITEAMRIFDSLTEEGKKEVIAYLRELRALELKEMDEEQTE